MNTYVLKNQEQTGPFNDDQIRGGLATGNFSYEEFGWREGMAEWQPLKSLYPPTPSAPPPPVASLVPAMQAGNRTPSLVCQTCGQGTLVKRKKHRMSGPAVVIGYILLIPSVIGMLVGVLILLLSGSAGAASSVGVERETRTRLAAEGIPAQIVQEVVDMKPVTQDQEALLTPQQRTIVLDAKTSLAAGKIGAGAGTAIGGLLAVMVIVACLVAGLLGWLLVMKKRVLQCNVCSAVVAAS